MPLERYSLTHHPHWTTGMEVKLDPIEKDLTESGSWYWKYKINGVHIRLELVDL